MKTGWLTKEAHRWAREKTAGAIDPIAWWLRSSSLPRHQRERLIELRALVSTSAAWPVVLSRWTATGCGAHVLPLFCAEARAARDSKLMRGMRQLAGLERRKRLADLSAAASVLDDVAPLLDVLETLGDPPLGVRDRAEFLRALESGLRKMLQGAKKTPLGRRGAPIKASLHAPLLSLNEYLVTRTGQPQHALVLDVLSLLDIKDATKSGLQQDLKTQRKALGNAGACLANNPLLVVDPPPTNRKNRA